MSETKPPVVVINPSIKGFGVMHTKARLVAFQDYHTGNHLSVITESLEEAQQLLNRLVVIRIWEEFFTDGTNEWLVKLPIQGEASDGTFGNGWDEGTAWEQARVYIVNTFFLDQLEQEAGVGPVQAALEALRKERQIQATMVASGVTFPTKVTSYEAVQVRLIQGGQQLILSLHGGGYFDLQLHSEGSSETSTLLRGSLREHL